MEDLMFNFQRFQTYVQSLPTPVLVFSGSMIVISSILLYKLKKLLTPPKHLRHLKGGNVLQTIYRLMFANLPGPYMQLRAKERFGKIYRSSIPGRWVIFVHDDVEAVKEILKNVDVFAKEDFASGNSKSQQMFLGKNLVFENGEQWARLRKICNPAFHWEYLKSFTERFAHSTFKVFDYIDSQNLLSSSSSSSKIINYLSDRELEEEREGNMKTVEVVPLMQKVTLDILGNCAFSVDFGCFDNNETEYVTLYNQIIHGVFNPLTIIFKKLDHFSFYNRKLKSSILRFNELLQKVIQERRNDIKMNKLTDRNPDLLDMMIQNEGGMTDEELKFNVNIFFVAGFASFFIQHPHIIFHHHYHHYHRYHDYHYRHNHHRPHEQKRHDTTSTTLSMALNFLALHPEIQEKARDEAKRVLGGKSSPTYDDIKELHYINQIIKETLRMWPPVSLLPPRETTEDVVLHGHRYPKGSYFAVCTYSLHHSPELWENPDQFDPDRFEAHKKIAPFAWIPFGYGPRTCIGNNFSLLEQRVFLSMFLLRYRVHPAPTIPSPQTKKTHLNFELPSTSFLLPSNLFLRFEKINV